VECYRKLREIHVEGTGVPKPVATFEEASFPGTHNVSVSDGPLSRGAGAGCTACSGCRTSGAAQVNYKSSPVSLCCVSYRHGPCASLQYATATIQKCTMVPCKVE